jgi:hypothetical protein
VLNNLLKVASLFFVEHELISVSEQSGLLLMLVKVKVILEQIAVIETVREIVGAGVVEDEFGAEDFHDIFDHLVHVNRLDDFPVEVTQLLYHLMIRIFNRAKVGILIDELNSVQFYSGLEFLASPLLEVFV